MIFAPWILQAGATFNLVCSITGTMGAVAPNGDVTQQSERSYTRVFRVDLAKGRWCADDCKDISRIVSATDAELILEQTKTANIDAFMRIDRASGAFSSRLQAGQALASGTGTCTIAPFTGLKRS